MVVRMREAWLVLYANNRLRCCNFQSYPFLKIILVRQIYDYFMGRVEVGVKVDLDLGLGRQLL
jgi:hypothetical protein